MVSVYESTLAEQSDIVSKGLDREDTILFGGCVLDTVIDIDTASRDIDAAAPDTVSAVPKLVGNLRENAFRIIEPHRKYFINMDTPVSMIFAKKRGVTYDVSLLEDTSEIGQFDLETMYWSHTLSDVVDRFNALDAWRKKQVHPVRGLERENPYLLINRLLNLCAKYDLPISTNAHHREYLEHLVHRIAHWKHPEHFHAVECRIACYSTLLKVLLRAKDRRHFANELQSVGVFSELLPEFNSRTSYRKLLRAVEAAVSKRDLVQRLLLAASAAHAETLSGKFQSMSLRRWDENDQDVVRSLS